MLVTGGTGFTGSHLVRRARREGHAVTSLDSREGLFADELRGLGATIRLRFLLFGDGQTTYHPVYIDNLVDLFFLATENPRASGRTYVGADEEYHTLNDLVRAVGEAIDVDVRIVHLPFAPVWLASAAVELTEENGYF